MLRTVQRTQSQLTTLETQSVFEETLTAGIVSLYADVLYSLFDVCRRIMLPHCTCLHFIVSIVDPVCILMVDRRMASSGMLCCVALVTSQKTTFFIVTAVKTSNFT
jgi:hypothetical protein